jgi:hypothetical protein
MLIRGGVYRAASEERISQRVGADTFKVAILESKNGRTSFNWTSNIIKTASFFLSVSYHNLEMESFMFLLQMYDD